MSYVNKSWIETQFQNFATRISLVFAKKADVPTKVSDLTNDSGFVTSAADNLSNYYKKSETYTKAEVNALTSGGTSALVFDTQDDLDTWMADSANVATLKVGQNIYIKAIDTPDHWWDGTQLQILETQTVDLTGYVTTEQLSTTLAGYVKTTDVETTNIDFSGYFAG